MIIFVILIEERLFEVDVQIVNLLFQSNRRTIMDDPFIRNYIEDLLKNIRTQVLLKLIKPYTRIRIPFISKVLGLYDSVYSKFLRSIDMYMLSVFGKTCSCEKL